MVRLDFSECVDLLEFIQEPILAILELEGVTKRLRPLPKKDDALLRALALNPLAYVQFWNGSYVLGVASLGHSELDLGAEAFDEMIHTAVLDKRGDRAGSFCGQPVLREELVARGILVDVAQARNLVSVAAKWCHHQWYPSLLWLVKAYYGGPARENDSFKSGNTPSDALLSKKLEVLLHRRTCRRFSRSFVDRAWLKELLSAITDNGHSASATPLRIYVEARLVRDLAPGNYAFSYVDLTADFLRIDSPSDDTHWISKQDWVAGSAFTIIIAAPLGGPDPLDDVVHLIQMGRIAQRAIVLAESVGLQVFVSPATNDSALVEKLAASRATWGFYTVSIGRCSTVEGS